MKIPKVLLQQGELNAYSEEGHARKAEFHKDGAKFLRSLAAELELPKGSYDVRSNLGGIAVSGEVTLHHERLYMWMQESLGSRGRVILTYRSCEGRKDYSGGRNNDVYVANLADPDRLEEFLSRCRSILNRAVA
ncbi:hypothetical protein F6X40_09705 [Paraburkholderia sp. UCT31]|uniref:hypothetical protein n=1 Tax=Paraburkholderia sp. UCT31 TaxID=2615209 RepID=UPI001655E241|nr:hypothetical protein [Paraburkholderia sp. UCT31]MBC8737082.1 hypothetical protein [Paraburkholderia sp. UCT31]